MKYHLKWFYKCEEVNPALERILIHFKPDDLWLKRCRQQFCRYNFALFDRILFPVFLLFALLTSVMTVIGRIRVFARRWVWRVIFLMLTTLFLLLAFLFLRAWVRWKCLWQIWWWRFWVQVHLRFIIFSFFSENSVGRVSSSKSVGRVGWIFSVGRVSWILKVGCVRELIRIGHLI